MGGAVEEAGKFGTSAVEAMKSVPLAIALLLVNIGFLSFVAYVLGTVASNANERNKTQTELITSLIKDIRECHTGPARPLSWLPSSGWTPLRLPPVKADMPWLPVSSPVQAPVR